MRDEILMKYLRGESSSAEIEEVLDWVEEDDKNMEELQFQRLAMTSALLCSPAKETPVSSGRSTRQPSARFAFFAACALCAVLATTGFMAFFKRNVEVQSVCAPVGQQTEVILSDGTLVWLNSNSSLSFSSLEGKKKIRRVRLTGEAYFEVARDESRPFVVETDDFTVRVLGTKFNVNTYTLNKTVVLSEGAVRVQRGSETYNLEPGEMYYQNEQNGRGIAKVDPLNYTSWTGGYLEFKGVSLDSVLESLQSFFGREFIYDKQAAMRLSISGKLELREGLEVSLSGLRNSSVLSYGKIREGEPVSIKIAK